MQQQIITDDLDALLEILPKSIAEATLEYNDSVNLLEVIMDLGRIPSARFVSGEVFLNSKVITQEEILSVTERIGDIDADNRAGLERTLHRISAIRNRRGSIVGLTCRVGRAVYGTTDIIKDLIDGGKSLLILGRPGVGKTTMLREAARMLATSKRVVIVDTSNEIGGDGDVPHPAVGRARRMQVAEPSLQHEVMIEAVENHSPEVIVIDEIGRELEAAAARTIAERGVQLIGTAHGNNLENLLLNPTLSDLVGGIESVTLSDEEARRRGTQKTVLERRSPPTFDVLIEIQTRDRLAVHTDVATSVDSLLRGKVMSPEIRARNDDGEISIEKPRVQQSIGKGYQGMRRQSGQIGWDKTSEERTLQYPVADEPAPKRQAVKIYSYGVARNRLIQSAKQLGVPVLIEKDIGGAQIVVTLRNHYRKRHQSIIDAENRGIPIYVLRSNTIHQMKKFLVSVFNLSEHSSHALNEEQIEQQTRVAIEAVLNGERWIELTPTSSYNRRIQHQMARQADLLSHSFGKEPNRRVRIYQE